MGEGEALSPQAAPPAAEESTKYLPADLLPAGSSPKSGDKFTFVVSGEPDEQGIPGRWETSGKPEPDEEKEWANGMREAMSPTAQSPE